MPPYIIKNAIENNLVIKVRCTNRRSSSSLIEMLADGNYENLYFASPNAPRYPINSFVYFEIAETEDLLLLLRKIKYTVPRSSAVMILEGVELITGEVGLTRETLQLIRDLSNKNLLAVVWLCFEGDKEVEPEMFDLSIHYNDILRQTHPGPI